jgi:zinc transport system permease protein
LISIHPHLASSRGINTKLTYTIFTVAIAVVVTLAISWVGLLILNSLLVLPGASARNVSKNLRQYHLFSIIFALTASIAGLCISYYLGTSAGAAISLVLALIFAVSFCLRKVRA